MKISVPALLVLAAAAKGNNVPALSDDLTITQHGASIHVMSLPTTALKGAASPSSASRRSSLRMQFGAGGMVKGGGGGGDAASGPGGGFGAQSSSSFGGGGSQPGGAAKSPFGGGATSPFGGGTSTRNCDIFQGRDACVRYAPHNDPQGMVCGNDSQNNKAYCNFINYQTDATACVIGRCGLTPAEVYEPRDWAELPTNVQELYGSLGYSAFW